MIKILQNTIAFGESGTPTDIVKSTDEKMLTFNVKVIDLPGPTGNGNMYPVDVVKRAIENPKTRQRLLTGSFYGEHDHPIDKLNMDRWVTVDMNNTSFKFTKLWLEGNTLYGSVQTVPINDNMLYKCIMAGEYPSFSIRVMGSLNPNNTEYAELDEMYLIAIDWVRLPGSPDAYLKNNASFSYMDSPILNGEYDISKRVQTFGESKMIVDTFLNKNEVLVSLEDGFFAAAEAIDVKKYNEIRKFRKNSFL